jgi:hypothetical protein
MHRPVVRAARALICAAAFLAAFPALPQAAGGREFLWEVVSVTNRAYLFGTIHAGKKDWYPLAPSIEAAFADSKVLVVEADISDVAAMGQAAPPTYDPPDSLAKHVPPADYARFLKLLPRYGLQESQLAQLKPFMAVSVLMFSEWARLGYLPRFGVDAYLIDRAKAEAKPIKEIEGLQTQVQLLDSMTEKEHRLAFDGTLKALESGLTAEQITGMVNAWQAGDPRLMLEIAQRYNEAIPGAREMEEKFVWSRHGSMLAKVEGYLNESKDRHFIAVGSLHLAGPKGLVEALRRRGYIVRQR